MNLDTIIYYAKKIYSNKLIYLDNYKPDIKNSSNFACFKIPEIEKE